MKKIALDLDGVVFDSEDLFRVYTEVYDVDINMKDTIIDNSEKLFQKRYNWSEEEKKNFYDTYTEKIIEESNLMPGADIVLNKLKDKYEFIIVTSRLGRQTEIGKNRLSNIGLNFKIYDNDTSKVEKLVEEKVDYVIDDDCNVCLGAKEHNITALYFKGSASKSIDCKEIITVNNWGEIYKYFMLNK